MIATKEMIDKRKAEESKARERLNLIQPPNFTKEESPIPPVQLVKIDTPT